MPGGMKKAAALMTWVAIGLGRSPRRDYFTADGQFALCEFRQFEDCALPIPRRRVFGDPLFSIDFDVNNEFMVMWRQRVPHDAPGR